LIPALTFKLLLLLALVLVEIGPYRNADVALLMKWLYLFSKMNFENEQKKRVYIKNLKTNSNKVL